MYHVGDKFIIEIGGIYNDKQVLDLSKQPQYLYKIKGFNSLVFDENGLNKLEKYKGQVDDICIGDELLCNEFSYIRFVVTCIDKDLIYGIRQNGMVVETSIVGPVKTGYHTDNISEYLGLDKNI